MRVARAFNTDIDFPVIITTVAPSAQPSLDPVLSQQIYRALANYLVSRASAELANDDTAEEETEPGMDRVVSDGSGVSNTAGRSRICAQRKFYVVKEQFIAMEQILAVE